MKLISLSIENFGKLHRYDLSLGDGLNTICEENGWGKTTLAAFLKAMFYGLPKSTKRDLDENDFKRYTPWQGGVFGGNLVFSSEKGTFRVERSFGESETFAIYDTATGLPSDAYSEKLGEELFGIDAEGFEESVFLSSRALAPKGGNDSVHAKLTGIDEINDVANYEKAYALLDERAKDYKKRGGGLIAETEEKIRGFKNALADARGKLQEQQSYERELALTREQIAQLQAEEKALQTALLRAKQVEEIRAGTIKLNDLVRQKETLENRFVGEIPARENLAACRKTIERMEITRAELAALGLNGEEQDELVALSRRFPTGAPSTEALNEKLRLATDLREKQTGIGQALASAQKDLQTAEDRLARLPSTEDLSRANWLFTTPKNTEKVAKKPKISLFFLCALLLLPAGAVALIVGLFKSLFPLSVGGIAALGAGLCCLILHIVFSLHQKRARAGEKALQNAEITSFLQRFGLSEAEEPRAALALLAAQRKDAEAARAVAEETCKTLMQERQACEQKAADLRAYLAGFEISGQDPESGLFRLAEYARSWEALWKKQQSAAAAEAQKKTALAADGAQVNAFLSRLPNTDSFASEKDRLDAMEDLLRNRETLCRLIDDRKAELQAKLAAVGLTDPALLDHEPDFAALSTRKIELEEMRSGLQNNENRLSAQLAKWQNETDQIPEWEEEVTRQSEALVEQKKRYELLVKTRDLLEKAHSDLTTRYLEPTRRNFANYLALLCGKDIPKATLAADFSVTVLDEGLSRKMESYSRGWRDLLQFCVRLSLIDALYADGNETPFLLLDDPFTNLDEERLAAAKALLGRLGESRQILYLVCHGDRT